MFSGPVRKAVESRALGKVGVIIEEDFSVPLCFVYLLYLYSDMLTCTAVTFMRS